jgi:hypothetical protein
MGMGRFLTSKREREKKHYLKTFIEAGKTD